MKLPPLQIGNIMEQHDDLEMATDKAIEATFHAEQRDYIPSHYHISDLSNGWGLEEESICLRQAYFRYRGKIEYNREMAGIYERGRLYEAKLGAGILSSLQGGWSIIDSQRELVHEVPDPLNPGCTLKFVAHPDYIAVHPPDTTQYVLEIKSVNFHSRTDFLDLVKLNSKFDYPKPPHILQANFYSYLLKKPFIIVYINTGDMSVRGFKPREAFPSERLFNVVVNRGIKLHEFLYKNEIPEAKKNWSCDMQMRVPKSYCPFFNVCHQTDGGPKAGIYAQCKACNERNPMIIPEDQLRVNALGELVCPKCSSRVGRYFSPAAKRKP